MNENNRLASLWDMLHDYSFTFGLILSHLSQMQGTLNEAINRFDVKDKEPDKSLTGSIKVLIQALKTYAISQPDLGLNLTIKSADRIMFNLELNQGYTNGQMKKDLEELKARFQDELESKFFYFVSPLKAKFYSEKNLFGDTVFERFPSVVDDLEDSGKCLALGLNTSAVMHLMRVLEPGLKALAKSLDVEYVANWHQYIEKINAETGKKRGKKSPEWVKKEEFYKDVAGDLTAIKNAWRNPSMHVGKRYDSEQALQIFNTSKSLMQTIATHLDEDGNWFD